MLRSLHMGVSAASRPLSSSSALPSTSQAFISSPSRGAAVFPSPLVETPSFEVGPSLSSLFSQTFYAMFLEKEFNRTSLLIGANEGLSAINEHIVKRNWAKIHSMGTDSLVHELQEGRDGLDESLVGRMLFTPHDVVHSFIYRSFFSGRKMMKVSESSNMFIYFMVVSYIRTSEQVPHGLSPARYLSKHRDQISIGNIGYARAVNPLGQWRVFSYNYSI